MYVDVYDYVGCYRDDGARDLNEGPHEYGYDPLTCREACADFPYYSLQNGGWCACGMGYGTAPQYEEIESSFCSKNSQKDRYYGGGWANSVFCNTDYVDPSEPEPTPEPEPEPEVPEVPEEPEPEVEIEHPYTYLGCYRDDGARDLNHGPH